VKTKVGSSCNWAGSHGHTSTKSPFCVRMKDRN
jgi:hypothetical protein